MRQSRTALTARARRLVGTPVCIEMKDGSRYIGTIAEVGNGKLMLAGAKSRGRGRGRGRSSSKRPTKAKVSGLLPGFGSFMGLPAAAFGGGGGGAALEAAAPAQAAGGGGLFGGFGGGLEGFMGFMGKAMPMVQMGMGMIKTIMPLLKGFGGGGA